MKSLILASIIALSVGIIGLQDADARCLDPNTCRTHWFIGPVDVYGNSVIELTPNEQYSFSYYIHNFLWVFLPCQETEQVNAISLGDYNQTVPVEKCASGNHWILDDRINDNPPSPVLLILQIKDEYNTVQHIEWIEDKIPPNTDKHFEFTWVPVEKGEYTTTIYVLKSFENLKPLKNPASTTFAVI